MNLHTEIKIKACARVDNDAGRPAAPGSRDAHDAALRQRHGWRHVQGRYHWLQCSMQVSGT